MSRYSLILHGALALTADARPELKKKLIESGYAVEQVEHWFSGLPATFKEHLELEQAEALKLQLESLGADVELLQEDEAQKDSEISEEPKHHETTSNDELLFSFSIDEAGHTVKESPAEAPRPEIPTVLFELDADVEEVKPSAPAPAPTIGAIHFEMDADSPAPEAQQNTGQNAPAALSVPDIQYEQPIGYEMNPGAPPVESESPPTIPESDSASQNEATASAQIDGDFYAPSTGEALNWKPQSIRRIEEREKENRLNKNYLIASACVFAALIFLIVRNPDMGPSLSLSVPVDQLIGEPVAPDAVKAAPKPTPIPEPFLEYYSGQRTEPPYATKIRLGSSKVGFDIAEFSFESDPPRKLTRQDYIQGKKETPWLRKFTADLPLPRRHGKESKEGGVVIITRTLVGRAVIEWKGKTFPTVASLFLNASYNTEERKFAGFWEVRNVATPVTAKNSVRELVPEKFEIYYAGDFSAALEAPATPQLSPAPMADAPSLTSSNENETPAKPKD